MGRRILAIVLLSLLTVTAFLAFVVTGHCATRERFAVSPRITIWAYQPIEVFARLVIVEPTVEHLCLGQLWAWGNGDISVREAYCTETVLPTVYMYSARYRYKAPGNFTVTLILFRVNEKGEAKPWKKYSQSVEIR